MNAGNKPKPLTVKTIRFVIKTYVFVWTLSAKRMAFFVKENTVRTLDVLNADKITTVAKIKDVLIKDYAFAVNQNAKLKASIA